MYYISLERSLNSASAHLCCIKIQTEMTEKSQVKYQVFIFTDAPVYVSLFHLLSLNMDLYKLQITQNGGLYLKYSSLDIYRKKISEKRYHS